MALETEKRLKVRFLVVGRERPGPEIRDRGVGGSEQSSSYPPMPNRLTMDLRLIAGGTPASEVVTLVDEDEHTHRPVPCGDRRIVDGPCGVTEHGIDELGTLLGSRNTHIAPYAKRAGDFSSFFVRHVTTTGRSAKTEATSFSSRAWYADAEVASKTMTAKTRAMQADAQSFTRGTHVPAV